MIKEKNRNLSLKTKVLLVLGLLIIAVILISMNQGPPSEAERNKGWDRYLENVYSSVIKFNNTGQPWIGTWYGLRTSKGDSWTSYKKDIEVVDIAFDLQGNTWVLSRPGRTKLSIFDGEDWIIFTDENSPLDEYKWFRSIDFDSSGRAWLTSWNQIWVFDGKHWEMLKTFGINFYQLPIYFLEIDQFDRVWIGLEPGVHVYDNGTWKSYATNNSDIIGDKINTICFDEDGNAWLGGEGGASFFDGDSWTNYHWSSHLDFDEIRAIEIDSVGRILFLSDSALRIFDGDNWYFYYSYNSGFPEKNWKSRDLAIGPEGNIWIASNEGVTLATVDDDGLPYGISPDKEFFFEYNFFDWNNYLTPLIILTLLLSCLAVYFENYAILVTSVIAGLSFMFIPSLGSSFFIIYDLGRPIIFPVLILGMIGSLIGGRVEKRRMIANKKPTTIGFIIGALFGYGGQFLFMLFLYYAGA